MAAGKGDGRRRRRAIDTHGWRRLRDAIVATWIAEHGLLCPGWDEPAHAVGQPSELTLDHVVPRAAGGTADGRLQILCRRCNGRKGQGEGGGVIT